jgi:acetyltransferase-like isoleucine patch superfamily enzyme
MTRFTPQRLMRSATGVASVQAMRLVTRLRFAGSAVRLSPGSWISWRSDVEAGEGGRIDIGARCEIHPFAMLLAYGGHIRLGDDCSINPFAVLYGHGGLTIGNGVRIATHAVIIPANHNPPTVDTALRDTGVTARGIRIDDDVWIGAGARILDGVHIGAHAIIGAGSVVTKSVPANATVAGVPARVLRQR